MAKATYREFLAAAIVFLVAALLPLGGFALSAALDHPLGRAEIFRAIKSFHHQRQPNMPLPFDMDALDLGSLPRVDGPGATLQVISVRFDRVTNRQLYRLRSASSPVPFVVSVKVSRPPAVPFQSARALPKRPSAPCLVDPRRLARLVLLSKDSEMVIEVRPLQKGDQGDIIRVRLPKNGRTFSARVTGPDSLQAEF